MTRFELLAQSQPNYNAEAVRQAMHQAKLSSKPTHKPTSKLSNKLLSKPSSKPTSKLSSSPSNPISTDQEVELFKTGTAEEVKKVVESNKVVVFAKTFCPFCKKAKALLESLNVDFATIELDELGELGQAVQASLQEMTGQSTVPSVFANQEHLGGSDDLAELVESDPEYFDNL